MKKNHQTPIPILLILSFIFIFAVSFILPLVPTSLCIGTNYAAMPVSMGYHNYLAFAASTLFGTEPAAPVLSTENIPESTADTAVENSKIEETQITYLKGELPSYENTAVTNETGYTLDLPALMENYTPIAKKTDQPQILILHTHATEAFADSDNRSTDNSRNMVAIGEVFAQSLTKRGFNVIHDTTQHDYPNYNGSYVNSLKTAEWYLKQYPSIEIILDLHRDGLVKEDGTKLKLTTEYEGQKVAQLMFVVGTDAGGLQHPNWKKNLQFAVGLQQQMYAISPTIMRPINLRTERFNQHTTCNTIIVECGSNGNDIEEVKRSVQLLAKAMESYIQ